MRWQWINPCGYNLVKIPGTRNPIRYDFQLDYIKPLTLLDTATGESWQPDRHAVTDMGSIPRWLQPLVDKDRYLLSWLLHDSGYQHGGLYLSLAPGMPFCFQPLSRLQLDAMMLAGIEAEGGGWFVRHAIYRAVRLGGWRGYRGKL